MIPYCAQCGAAMHPDDLTCPVNVGHHGTITPAIHTDAAPSVGDHTPLVFLAGAIKYWWDKNWNSPAHREYLQWRRDIRTALIEADYLTYAPHEAFKGVWTERAQEANDAVIRISDVFLIMSGPEILSRGTDEEIRVADDAGVLTIYGTSEMGVARVLDTLNVALKVRT